MRQMSLADWEVHLPPERWGIMVESLKTRETATVEGRVSGITDKGFWIGYGAPRWSSDRDKFIPRSQIIDSDTDLDEIQIGEAASFEVPLWLARREGLAE